MEVERDSEVPARLRGLRAQIGDSVARMRSMAYTVEDVLYGVIEVTPAGDRECLVLALLLLRQEQATLEGLVDAQLEPVIRRLERRRA